MKAKGSAARRRRIVTWAGGAACALGGGVIAWAAVVGSTPAPATATAASGGDANAGTIKVSNVGDAATNDHDPQLACANLDVWGSKLADPSGGFVIDGWPPSGSKEVDYSATWSYNTAAGGLQIIAVVPVDTLMSAALANGDTAANHGFHFKLALTQDPSKFKTFWLACSSGVGGSSTSTSSTKTTTSSTTTSSTTSSSTSSTTTSTTSTTSSTTSTTTTASTPASTTSSTPGGGVSASTTSSTPAGGVSTSTTSPAISVGGTTVRTPNTGAGDGGVELLLGTTLVLGGAVSLGLSASGRDRRRHRRP